MSMCRCLAWGALCWGLACGVLSPPAAAIPVFARIYDKPCGTCHTVFPQLNPQGEHFRAHGFHGLPAVVKPLRVGSLFDLPGTLPLALYLTTGEDLSKVDVSGQRDPTHTHFNLNDFHLLAGGEVGRHLAFLLDYELLEAEPDSGEVETYTLPYQAYAVGHTGWRQWLVNFKAGWYELPLGASPQIHRLSAGPYLVYQLNACSLLDVTPAQGDCESQPTLGQAQIGAELSAAHPASGVGWAAGFTNGSNYHLDSTASKDVYLRVSQALGLHRLGLFLFYSPDIVGHGAHDRTVRFGPDLDFYTRRFRLLGQFLAAHESNPTGRLQALWYYGGFLEAEYRFTPSVLSLLRVDYGWTPRFDDRMRGGETRVKRRLWEITGGGQWLLWQNVKLVAEVTYGENHEVVSDNTVQTWSGTLRLVTAFFPLAPAGPSRPAAEQRLP
jgi:hypothetical protein